MGIESRFNDLTARAALRAALFLLALTPIVASATGCGLEQIHSDAHHRSFSLGAGDLEKYGLAFITPSTVTGQEEEKQSVAFVFAEVLKGKRPNIPCLTLAETLSAINEAGIAEQYRTMYVDYRDTGIFKRDSLEQIGEVTKSRYVAQLKLAGFSQGSQSRIGVFGVRLVDTEIAHLRLFFQIWDTTDGSIAWEAVYETDYAYESVKEKAVTLRAILHKTAVQLVQELP